MSVGVVAAVLLVYALLAFVHLRSRARRRREILGLAYRRSWAPARPGAHLRLRR